MLLYLRQLSSVQGAPWGGSPQGQEGSGGGGRGGGLTMGSWLTPSQEGAAPDLSRNRQTVASPGGPGVTFRI